MNTESVKMKCACCDIEIFREEVYYALCMIVGRAAGAGEYRIIQFDPLHVSCSACFQQHKTTGQKEAQT